MHPTVRQRVLVRLGSIYRSSNRLWDGIEACNGRFGIISWDGCATVSWP